MTQCPPSDPQNVRTPSRDEVPCGLSSAVRKEADELDNPESSARDGRDPTWVVMNRISSQFEAVKNSEAVAVLGFRRTSKHFDLLHTYVLPEYRGRGLAHELLDAALDAIQFCEGTVTPHCGFVRRVLESDRTIYAAMVVPIAEEERRSASRSERLSHHRSWRWSRMRGHE